MKELLQNLESKLLQLPIMNNNHTQENIEIKKRIEEIEDIMLSLRTKIELVKNYLIANGQSDLAADEELYPTVYRATNIIIDIINRDAIIPDREQIIMIINYYRTAFEPSDGGAMSVYLISTYHTDNNHNQALARSPAIATTEPIARINNSEEFDFKEELPFVRLDNDNDNNDEWSIGEGYIYDSDAL